MSKNKNKQTNKEVNKQAGFSLIELMIALGVIAVLVAAIVSSSMSLFSESSKKTIARDVTAAIPTAVSICSGINRGVLTTCNKASLMRKTSTLANETACGDTWTITPSAAEVVLTYPLSSCDDRDDIGNDVIELLSKIPRISTDVAKTNYTSPNLKVTYLRK